MLRFAVPQPPIFGMALAVLLVACGEPPAIDDAVTVPNNALTEDQLYAVDLAIVLYVTTLSSDGEYQIAPELLNRLSADRGDFSYQIQVSRVGELVDGQARIQDGGNLTFDFTGALDVNVSFVAGQIGLSDGELDISDDARVFVDDLHFARSGDSWFRTDPPGAQAD